MRSHSGSPCARSYRRRRDRSPCSRDPRPGCRRQSSRKNPTRRGSGTSRKFRHPSFGTRTVSFASEWPAGENRFASPRIDWAAVHLPHGIELWRVRQPAEDSLAHSSAAGSNVQRRGSSMTPSFTPSFPSHAATAERVSSWNFAGSTRLFPSGVWVARQSQRVRDDFVRAIRGRIAGDDAVVVGREALRFHHRLVAAGRAAVEVGAIGKPAGVVADDQLARFGHQVNRAIRPVDDLLRDGRCRTSGRRRCVRYRWTLSRSRDGCLRPGRRS